MAGLQVNDAEPPHAQRQARRARLVDEKAILVWAAVLHRRSHCSHSRLGFGRATRESDTTDAAHALFDLRGAEKRHSRSHELGAESKSGNLQPVISVPPQQEPQEQKNEGRKRKHAKRKK